MSKPSGRSYLTSPLGLMFKQKQQQQPSNRASFHFGENILNKLEEHRRSPAHMELRYSCLCVPVFLLSLCLFGTFFLFH